MAVRNIYVTMNTRQFVNSMMANDKFIEKKAIQVVDRLAMWMKLMAQHYVPIDTGRLKRTIGVSKSRGGLSADIVCRSPYGVYVEYGTGLYATSGTGRRTPWTYRNKFTGKWGYTAGQKPKFFFKKAFEETINNVDTILQGVFRWR